MLSRHHIVPISRWSGCSTVRNAATHERLKQNWLENDDGFQKRYVALDAFDLNPVAISAGTARPISMLGDDAHSPASSSSPSERSKVKVLRKERKGCIHGNHEVSFAVAVDVAEHERITILQLYTQFAGLLVKAGLSNELEVLIAF